MSPERTHLSLRLVAFTALLIAGLSLFATPRYAYAIGEPTLTIMMDDTALTAGSVSAVTFVFSAVPIGFDNADVDLSDANGTLSPVAPTADPRNYRAVFTPNVGVDDPTNTIRVGTQWTDPLGVSPLADSTGPNFTVNTTSAPSSGGSGCPAPSVVISSPKGGETFGAGDAVDVFWTANGCQVVSIRLTLSTDGGANFTTPVVTSATPFYGYYRWTVPDLDTGMARLQATLLGPGDVVLATGMTNGDFAIASTVPASSEPAPVPPPEPAPAPPVSGSATQPAATAPVPAPSEPQGQGGAPAPSPTTLASTAPAAGAPSTTTMQAIETDQPMPETNENPTLTIGAVQGAVEAASSFAPSVLVMGFSFALGALSMLLLMLGAQKVLREQRAKRVPRCKHCYGTGEEPSEMTGAGTCGDCDGAGSIEEEEEQAVDCKHCEGEGVDPCHECKGIGKDASGNECGACRGGGKTLSDPEDEDAEPADCEICDGEGEVSATIKKQASCEKCGGTGRI